jgi:hypothetical protein
MTAGSACGYNAEIRPLGAEFDSDLAGCHVGYQSGNEKGLIFLGPAPEESGDSVPGSRDPKTQPVRHPTRWLLLELILALIPPWPFCRGNGEMNKGIEPSHLLLVQKSSGLKSLTSPAILLEKADASNFSIGFIPTSLHTASQFSGPRS